MKKFLCILLAFLLLLGCIGCNNSSAESTKPVEATNPGETQSNPGNEDTVKVGVVGLLQSSGISYFDCFDVAAKMAMDEINANGGIGGKDLEIVFATGVTDSTECKQRFTELKEKGCIAIYPMVDDSYGPAAAQWASENKTPVFGAGNTSTAMSIENYSDYMFFCCINAWGATKVWADQAVKNRGYKNFMYVGTDGAATIDAENFFLMEAQKIDPSFRELASYRMAADDSDFSTVMATILSSNPSPDMILQQGGGVNIISFTQTANLYNMYDICEIWNDLATMPPIVEALVEAGEYPYGHMYGVTAFPYWLNEFKWFVEEFNATAQEMFPDRKVYPSEGALGIYWAFKSLQQACNDCIAAGKDFTNSDELAAALANVRWTDDAGEHYYRDFDHQLMFDVWFNDTVDGGSEYDNYPIGGNMVRYTAEEYLPTREEMEEYAISKGFTNRF
ncbi:MAG: ABC transporter substrate-binding protein [Oscillospiraceae bacterium]|nr:ABC transporter substrate-binding protein [Oscillospiraceae bacterium]